MTRMEAFWAVPAIVTLTMPPEEVDTVWSGSSAVLGLDGDGRQVRSAETVYDPQTQTETTTTKYFVRTTVLGGEVLTELEPANGYSRWFVSAGGAVIAFKGTKRPKRKHSEA